MHELAQKRHFLAPFTAFDPLLTLSACTFRTDRAPTRPFLFPSLTRHFRRGHAFGAGTQAGGWRAGRKETLFLFFFFVVLLTRRVVAKSNRHACFLHPNALHYNQ